MQQQQQRERRQRRKRFTEKVAPAWQRRLWQRAEEREASENSDGTPTNRHGVRK